MIDDVVGEGGGRGSGGRGVMKAKGPALLPPHLLRALLNTASPTADPSLLPVGIGIGVGVGVGMGS